mgnify:CR=1 FL=1
MAANFNELLDTNMDDIERPKPLPPGTYFGTVKEYTFDESSQNKTPYVRYIIVNLEPGEDVDRDALREIPDVYDRTVRRDFFLTQNAKYRLKEFIASTGMKVDGRSLRQCIADSVNCRVIVQITQVTSRDGKEIYNNVGELRGIG